jgi:glycosyltransferase involved in cell wall biosynthesis
LLFISTSFYLKGGRELIKAYLGLKKRHSNLRLTIITKIKPKIRRDYGGIDGLELIEAKYPKEELYRRFYCEADIFVVPSYQDSFGMVFLEAIASGLPVISTKMYAIPEIVEEGKNGFLIDPPFKLWHQDGTTSAKLWRTDLYDLTERREFPAIVAQVEKLLERLIVDHQLRRSFARHSLELVKNGKFSSTNRLKKLSQLFTMADK